MPWIGKKYYNMNIPAQRKACNRIRSVIRRKKYPNERKKHDDDYRANHKEDIRIRDAIYYALNKKRINKKQAFIISSILKNHGIYPLTNQRTSRNKTNQH